MDVIGNICNIVEKKMMTMKNMLNIPRIVTQDIRTAMMTEIFLSVFLGLLMDRIPSSLESVRSDVLLSVK